MAVNAWPFAGPDRPWGADEWRQFMVHMREPGIIADVDQEMLVEAVTDELQSVVRPGMAFIAGHQVVIDADETVDHDTADLSDPRIDLVVLTTDWTTAERQAYVEVITGTPAASPSAPTPTQDDVGDTEGVWQEPLAEVTVAAAAGETGGHTDVRSFMEVPGRLLVVDDEADLNDIDPTFHRFAVVAPGTASATVRFYNTDTGSWETVIAGDFATESYVDTAVDNATDQLRRAPVERSSKDSEGIFTVVEWNRLDGTRWKRSELSGGTSPEYSQRTVTFYDTDGTTVTETTTYDLTYDGDGDLTAEAVAP